MPQFIENRGKKEFFIFKKPKQIVDEERSVESCCEPFLTLFSDNDSASHKNDVNSAWSLGESVTFTLKKNGLNTNYQPQAVAFPNQTNAFYTTVKWREVAAVDGVGVYSLYVNSSIAGVQFQTLWGSYNVLPYVNDSGYYLGKGTVRLRSLFNDMNTIVGIDFTDANVQDTIRVRGVFGFWQPSTQIDNLVYNDGERRKVRREDLTEFQLKIDLHTECVIERLRFHLIAENDCFITDHNPFNYTYKYLDYPVIVKSGFEPSWKDLTRRVSGVAKFEDKVKNTKTHFNKNG